MSDLGSFRAEGIGGAVVLVVRAMTVLALRGAAAGTALGGAVLSVTTVLEFS